MAISFAARDAIENSIPKTCEWGVSSPNHHCHHQTLLVQAPTQVSVRESTSSSASLAVVGDQFRCQCGSQRQHHHCQWCRRWLGHGCSICWGASGLELAGACVQCHRVLWDTSQNLGFWHFCVWGRNISQIYIAILSSQIPFFQAKTISLIMTSWE